MKSILAIGELLWDLLPDGRKLGGAPANFAYRLQELGDEVAMVSRIGADALGEEALAILGEAGLDTSFIQQDQQHPTGTVDVFFDEHKNPDYHINTDAAYDFIEVTVALLQKASNVDCLAFGTLAQRSETTKDTIHKLINQASEALKFCDINLRKACYTTESVTESLKLSNIVKLNHNELKELSSMFGLSTTDDAKAAQELCEKFGLKMCLVTYEEFGALAVTESEVVYSPGYQVKLEDALGAGDAFSAAFIHKYLLGRPLLESLEAGNLNGAMVAMQKGAMQPLDQQLFRQIMLRGYKRVAKTSLTNYMRDQDILFQQ